MSLRMNRTRRPRGYLVPLAGLALLGVMSCGQVERDDAQDGEPDSMAGGSRSADDGAGGSAGHGQDDGEDGAGGSVGTGGLDGNPLTFHLNGQPVLSGFVRLTPSQWRNSVQDIFELSTLPETLVNFASAPVPTTFQNNEKGLIVGDEEWADHFAGATAIAERVASDAGLLEKLGGADDPKQFIRKIGKRAFRRTLGDAEVARYEALWLKGAEDAEFLSLGTEAADGARVFLEALLQSPHFLYRIELSPAGDRLTGLELATKLSLLLADTTPSDALLEAAEAGELDTDAALVESAAAMLAEPSGADALVRFHGELYRLDRYASVIKDSGKFPSYSIEFNESIRTADELLFARVYDERGGLRHLLTTPTAFIDARTASYYGQEPPSSGFAAVDLDGRPGILTRLGFLASRATPLDPSPVGRGSFILTSLLCAGLSPPSSTIPVLPPREPDQTSREWLTEATSAQPCSTCHGEYLNPLGFAFDSFDALGQERSIDNGHPIDTTGGFPFTAGFETFTGADELVRLLADDRLAHECYSAKMAEYALARDLRAADEEEILTVARSSFEDDASMQDLVLQLVESPLFTHARSL